jgi:hypothetical protein
MSDMTALAVSKRETSMLKSREKANDFCGLLCAFRLLDVSIGMEIIKDKSHLPPKHNQMGIDLPSNEVSSFFIFIFFAMIIIIKL